ncbi:MAG: Gfo/Idh/MocA family oxidoreductase [Sphaerochaetaceae bacterium]|nr:Gfo/Idh/MocA family oxidoreductase [Sphaerochaetaceae bacterium]
MKKRGVAIIGTGGIAPFHIEGYLSEKGRTEIVALCDLFTDKCEKIAEKFNLNLDKVTITSEYKTLLDRDDIDIVSLCIPPNIHCEVACAFLNHGKHVLCEKPMASSLEEADLMIEAQKKSNKQLGIISQNRFRESAWKVKKMIDSGVFGKVYMTRVNSMWFRGLNYYKLWWRGTWEKEGGGCTLNHSVHQIDMLNWFIGMPNKITSVCANVAHTNSEVEDCGMSILEYPNSLAQINVSLNDMNEKQEIFFQCEKAEVSIPWSVHCMKQKENGFCEPDEESEAKFNEIYENLEGVDGQEGHSAEIKNFIDSLDGTSQLVVTSKDGRNALELIYGIYKSSTLHQTVTLPLSENDLFYKKETVLENVPHYFEKSESIDNSEGDITTGNMKEGK